MRTYAFWPVALFAITLFLSPAAFALTIDNQTGMNTDGTAKFADPDEQMPNLLNTPLTPPGSSPGAPNGVQVTPGTNFSFSGNAAGGPQQQQDAFDHAYAHFGN